MAPRNCTTTGCEKPQKSKSLCSAHYEAERRKRNTCKLAGCNRTHGREGRWYCRPHEHYAFINKGPEKTAEYLAKFRGSIVPDWEAGCWNWDGNTIDGYGRMHAAGPWLAHRFSYVVFNGGHAQGRQLDHLCNNTLCVRPDHLQPVTDKVNSRRRNRREKLGDLPYWQDSVYRPIGGNLLHWAMFNNLPLTKPGIEMVRAQ